MNYVEAAKLYASNSAEPNHSTGSPQLDTLIGGTRFALCTRQVMHQHTDHPSYTEKPAGQSFELAFPAGKPENVHTWYKQLVAHGATPVKPPELMPWGRVTAFIADPDGNIHELYS